MPKLGWNKPAQEARSERAQRVDRDLRVGGGSGDTVIGGEQALSFAAEQQRADHRDVAEDRVQRIGGDDRALQIEPVRARRSSTPLAVTPIALPIGKKIFENQMLRRYRQNRRATC